MVSCTICFSNTLQPDINPSDGIQAGLENAVCEAKIFDNPNQKDGKKPYCRKCKKSESLILKILSFESDYHKIQLLQTPGIDIVHLFTFLCQVCKSKESPVFKEGSVGSGKTNRVITLHSLKLQARVLLDLIYRYVDFTDILVKNIKDEDLATRILTHPVIISWYKLYEGKTMLETVLQKGVCPQINSLIKKKAPLALITLVNSKISAPSTRHLLRGISWNVVRSVGTQTGSDLENVDRDRPPAYFEHLSTPQTG